MPEYTGACHSIVKFTHRRYQSSICRYVHVSGTVRFCYPFGFQSVIISQERHEWSWSVMDSPSQTYKGQCPKTHQYDRSVGSSTIAFFLSMVGVPLDSYVWNVSKRNLADGKNIRIEEDSSCIIAVATMKLSHVPSSRKALIASPRISWDPVSPPCPRPAGWFVMGR